jgi:hypothetical protein
MQGVCGDSSDLLRTEWHEQDGHQPSGEAFRHKRRGNHHQVGFLWG